MIAGRSRNARILGGIGLYAAVGAYVIFALFPLFWTLKISVTPQSLLYSEGITMWPSTSTWENYATVLRATDFPRYFLNSVIVSVITAILVTMIAAAAGYAMSRFLVPGQDDGCRDPSAYSDLPAGHGHSADLSDHGSAWTYQ